MKEISEKVFIKKRQMRKFINIYGHFIKDIKSCRKNTSGTVSDYYGCDGWR